MAVLATPKAVMPHFIARLTNKKTKKAKREAEPLIKKPFERQINCFLSHI
jgi:hypothetical protein